MTNEIATTNQFVNPDLLRAVAKPFAAGSLVDVSTVGERLAQILVLRGGISARELDRRAGLTEGTTAIIIARYKRNPRASTETGTLQALARGGEVSERWLMLGEGTPESDDVELSPSEAIKPVWSQIAGWEQSEAQVRRDHPEWTDDRAWSAARGSGPYMAPAGGVQPIHVEELYRLAVRLGAGGDLRLQIDANRAQLGAEVHALREGTLKHPKPPPPERTPRRGRR